MKHLTKGNRIAPIDPKKGFRIHLFIFLMATPIVWLILHWINVTYPWQLWQTAAWAIGVLFHYLGVFVFKKNIKKSAL